MSRALIACERSGVVRRAFRALGVDAYSCDLVAADDGSPHHIVADATALLREGWDLLIAFPPCTYLTTTGAPELVKHPVRRLRGMSAAIDVFLAFLNADHIPRRAVENPRPFRAVTRRVGRWSDTIQPHWFGEPYTKRTCLWLRNLPPLMPTLPTVPTGGSWVLAHREPSKRSETFQGVGAAMAAQWAPLLTPTEPR